MLFLVASLIFGAIGWVTYKLYIWPYYFSPLRNIPGPPSENILYGNMKRFSVEEAGEAQQRWVKIYGNVVKFYGLFNQPAIIVADTKMIQEITLNQAYDFVKPPSADAIAIAGKGLVLAEGDAHKRQRKMMSPAFTHNNIKDMVPTINHVTLALKSIIEDKLNKGESKIILSPYISKTTLDVIGLVGFNYKFNSLTSPNELADAYECLMGSAPTTLRIIISILSNYIPFIRYIPIKANTRFNNACKVIDRVSKQLVEDKYREAKENELNGKDLLSLLINLNKKLPTQEKMTMDELKYQIMTFLVAGHETTSVATCWALHSLAQHPHEQDLLREELVKAFPDKSKFDPTFDEINSLEYLNCVVKETLRLYSPATLTSRKSIKDKALGKYFIPKDTLIIIGISALHRLSSIWGPTAEDFIPKRWLDPSLIKDVSNFCYLPFYTGTRSCIGSKLALTEFKILLSMLIRNYTFQSVEGLHIRKKIGSVSKPEPYLELIVSKVEA